MRSPTRRDHRSPPIRAPSSHPFTIQIRINPASPKNKNGRAKLNSQVSSAEEELNDLVFQMYGLSKDEQKIVDDFLTRYSSSSPAVVAEELEGQPPESLDDANV